MSKDYVIKKLNELNEAIDTVSDETFKELVNNASTFYENSTVMYHVHSPEFLRQT